MDISAGLRVNGISVEESNKVINNPGDILDGIVNLRLLRWISDVNPPSKREHNEEQSIFTTIREVTPIPSILFLCERPAHGVSPPWLNDPPPFYPVFLETLNRLDSW